MLILSLVAAITIPVIQQDTVLDRIRSVVVSAEVMCGDFEQKKNLKGLSRPVSSSGRFCVADGHGVLWNTEKPFSSSLSLRKETIVESRAGKEVSRMSVSDQPSVRLISDLLSSVLEGDLHALDKTFIVKASMLSLDKWEARLLPRDSGMKKFMVEVVLRGSRYVESVEMLEATGDNTRIDFSGIATGMASMRSHESRDMGIGSSEVGKPY